MDISKPMPSVIEWNGKQFEFMDQPEHETDHADHELFRYIEKAT